MWCPHPQVLPWGQASGQERTLQLHEEGRKHLTLGLGTSPWLRQGERFARVDPAPPAGDVRVLLPPACPILVVQWDMNPGLLQGWLQVPGKGWMPQALLDLRQTLLISQSCISLLLVLTRSCGMSRTCPCGGTQRAIGTLPVPRAGDW